MTNEKLLEIGRRIKILREILEIPIEEVATAANMSVEECKEIEEGKIDFSAGYLIVCAELFGVDTTELLTGDAPRLATFAVSRAGTALSIKRSEGFEYLSLAHQFKNKIAEPLYVTATYNKDEENLPIDVNSHEGQEFDYILSGQLKVQVKNKITVLNEGDSIYFDSSNPHGMRAVGGKDCVFLAIVIKN